MADLSTQFMGLSLPNPLVVSSSGLTASVEAVRKAVDAGAGAVVLKSLFEEDIAAAAEKAKSSGTSAHPEAEAYLGQINMLLEPDEYLGFVEDCSRDFDVPVIASLNCHSDRWWTDYAGRIEKVGADAIELNLSPMALDAKTDSKSMEDRLVAMVKLARKTVEVPLAVKLGPNWSALPHLAGRLDDAGADALTLFNRYYAVDIDVDAVELKAGNSLSAAEEFGPVLRWIGILSDLTDLDLAASTGVFSSSDLIKVLLAGGQVAQFCSVLYREGVEVIRGILDETARWMDGKGYASVQEFRGLLSLEDDQRNAFYQRLQYVKALKGR